MTDSSLLIQERVGDIFESPPHSILIQDACNTRGSWGKGVALAFKKYSPQAFYCHRAYCDPRPTPSYVSVLNEYQNGLLGTCQLIPPFPFQSSSKAKLHKATAEQDQKRFWIACLFTSSGYGKNTDPSDRILENTKLAMRDLKAQIEKHGENKGKGDGEEEMGDVYSVRINSGLFGVDWERTKEVLEEVGVPMVVVAREEDQQTEKEKGGKKRTAMDEFVSKGKRAKVKY